MIWKHEKRKRTVRGIYAHGYGMGLLIFYVSVLFSIFFFFFYFFFFLFFFVLFFIIPTLPIRSNDQVVVGVKEGHDTL